MGFYDAGTGQSCFTGPASYNTGLSQNKMFAQPCSARIVT